MILINGSPLNITLFPDNTSQVWKIPQLEIPNTNWVHITWEFTHEGEFLHLAQLKDLLDIRGFRAALRIKYLPYGRQDKEISNSTTFALRTFARLLNSLDFEEIIIHDPHSKIALDLIKNSRAQYPVDEVMKIAYILETDVFCYPDEGAYKKYTGFPNVQDEIYDYPCLLGEKVRDQLTGQILKFQLKDDNWINPKDKSILIVDDICDGGATFIFVAKALKEAGAKEVNLFVTHGIFSKGLRVLKESGINRIFTQDGEVSEIQGHIAYEKL